MEPEGESQTPPPSTKSDEAKSKNGTKEKEIQIDHCITKGDGIQVHTKRKEEVNQIYQIWTSN